MTAPVANPSRLFALTLPTPEAPASSAAPGPTPTAPQTGEARMSGAEARGLVANLTGAVSAARDLVGSADSFRGQLPDEDAVGTGLSFAGHYLGDDCLGGSEAYRAFEAGVAAGAEWAVANSAKAAEAPLAFFAAASAADSFLDYSDAAKLPVAVAAALDPVANVSGAARVAVDATKVLVDGYHGGFDVAQARAQRLQDNALGGEYGTLVQSVTLVGGAALGNDEIITAADSDAARQGELGVGLAVGHYLSDELSPSRDTDAGRMVPTAEAESRESAAWYKPWTW